MYKLVDDYSDREEWYTDLFDAIDALKRSSPGHKLYGPDGTILQVRCSDWEGSVAMREAQTHNNQILGKWRTPEREFQHKAWLALTRKHGNRKMKWAWAYEGQSSWWTQI